MRVSASAASCGRELLECRLVHRTVEDGARDRTQVRDLVGGETAGAQFRFGFGEQTPRPGKRDADDAGAFHRLAEAFDHASHDRRRCMNRDLLKHDRVTAGFPCGRVARRLDAVQRFCEPRQPRNARAALAPLRQIRLRSEHPRDHRPPALGVAPACPHLDMVCIVRADRDERRSFIVGERAIVGAVFTDDVDGVACEPAQRLRRQVQPKRRADGEQRPRVEPV